MSVPASRRLAVVLREALRDPGTELRVIAGVYAATPSPDARFANVVIHGEPLTIPNLNAQPPGAPGEVVYILADRAHMWVMGTMNPTAMYGIPASGVTSAVFSNSPITPGVVVNHGLGVVPKAVFLQGQANAQGASATVGSISATQFSWLAATNSGGNYTGTVTFYWIAIG